MNEEHLTGSALTGVPVASREDARRALLAVLPHDPVVAITPVTGGASGAVVLRVAPAGSPSLLLRIETARDLFRNPHRSYPCLRAAADAGVAPAVHVADPDAGVMIMDFVEQRPMSEHPGGPVGVLRELGELLARLQATPVAPPLLDDFASVLSGMLEYVEGAGTFADGVLAPVRDGFERISGAYPWRSDAQVSSHNDVNPYNVLFDGERLWLIDWELAFRNDPLADVAGAANNFIDTFAAVDGAPAAELEAALVHAWLGRSPLRSEHARLHLMRQMNRLFYACLMLTSSPTAREPEHELGAMTPDEFRTAIESGRLRLGHPDLLHEMGKMQLAGFLAGCAARGFDEVLRDAGNP